jgi:hypothetical protein
MKKQLRCFRRGEQGQDLIEYTPLMAFFCLTSAALFLGDNSVSGTWTSANSHFVSRQHGCQQLRLPVRLHRLLQVVLRHLVPHAVAADA